MSLEERIEQFVSELISSPKLQTRYFKFPLKLGDDWFSLLYVSGVSSTPERFHLTLRFQQSELRFDGSISEIVNDVAALLQRGLCRDCGGANTLTHECRNTCINKLLNEPDIICTICQEPCKGTTRMPCGHGFHWTCLSSVYDNNACAPCPNCRKRVFRMSWDYYLPHIEEDDSTDEE